MYKKGSFGDRLLAFIKTILADLGETYKRSNIPQLKVLLGAICPSGLAWDYSGTLRPTINPLYQAIRDFGTQGVPSGARLRKSSDCF